MERLGLIGAIASIVFQLAGCYGAWRFGRKAGAGYTLIGSLLLGACLLGWTFELGRPPMQTLGETRLWYAFLLPIVGTGVYLCWHFRWILVFTTGLSAVFLLLNGVYPDHYVRDLPPALQSGWFVPHVLFYMVSYSLLGSATFWGLSLCWRKPVHPSQGQVSCRQLVRLGLSFLTLGMLTGACWAQDAWGHYWGWDPKETWAVLTWFGYLLYVHLYPVCPHRTGWLALVLCLAFICLQCCWWGLSFLPAAQGNSLHVYGYS
ncbi:cytochrome c biogenesis protein ccsA [gut metagenome]|uniref:Cytochrome c biogenesis protein ccsA n=1 Tax=gut metagenome TaxID=749906 RepID=J9CTA3_9ZZZZ